MSSSLKLDAAAAAAVADQLRAAGHDLSDLAAADRRAADLVRAAARPPVRTGRLAASLTADVTAGGVAFASSARYWTFVHYGAPRAGVRANPWWREAVRVNEDEVAAVYAAHVQDTVKGIRG